VNRSAWRWPQPAGDLTALAAVAGGERLLAAVLAGRGMNAAAAAAWLQPALPAADGWRALPDIDRAVARIRQAVAAQETVLVFGDRDVDGMTATAVMVAALREVLPAERVHWTIPAPEEGYGLNVARVRDFAARTGAALVVTVDCGISAVDEVAALAALGIDTVITDHHEPAATLPAAVAVVDPKRADSGYPERMLAGVGVALRTGEALISSCGGDAAAWRDRQLALAALGTVADMVPLTGENRALAWHGLRGLGNPELPGLRALRRTVTLAEPVPVGRDIAFGLAPLLNAAGRMGENELGAQLLLCANDAAADALVQRLQELNAQRRELGAVNLAAAETAVAQQCGGDDRFIVVALDGVAHGVTGIVAAQLQKRYRRPVAVLIIDDGVAQGTARSVEGWDLLAAVREADDLLTRYGGHQQAVGMSLPAARVPELRTRLNAAAARTLAALAPRPQLVIDAVIAPAEATVAGIRALAALEPLGVDNGEPRFATRALTLQRYAVMGQERNHLRLSLADADTVLPVVAWNRADLAGQLTEGARYDIIYMLRLREWQGRVEPQAVLADIRPAEGA